MLLLDTQGLLGGGAANNNRLTAPRKIGRSAGAGMSRLEEECFAYTVLQTIFHQSINEHRGQHDSGHGSGIPLGKNKAAEIQDLSGRLPPEHQRASPATIDRHSTITSTLARHIPHTCRGSPKITAMFPQVYWRPLSCAKLCREMSLAPTLSSVRSSQQREPTKTRLRLGRGKEDVIRGDLPVGESRPTALSNSD
ncbi:hypothetical protein GGTG_03036 [Gaeumannomyces tritici R3-111a-1]|uniref:Uncharacterized protein n=1 Tax=Gaeumannomyces tritici (strain R3-111a-1) TaxID=644352 RepID=J3NP30_GAET3|nr:hypothetical protein GGTG_03036 [Gaeumannomyces tritici R3-111a-1]EJT77933.1 hypothetical protein GGTG_03036 [Gaeumannomyces tritici R3-111a-1]